jgi:hypothetical protein
MEIIAARSFNSLYIYLDILWLVFYALILIWQKRYLAFVAGLIGGFIYFIVDYGVFYLLLGTRNITGADPFWFLLWLSMSYGFTNFAWIWLLLDRDGHTVEWSLLTVAGWIGISMLSQNFGANYPLISISRGTTAYHGVMAIVLVVGYLYLIIHNLRTTKSDKINILRLLSIGIGVQFSWEFILLISGIRPAGFLPLIVNSLIETNLGMPYLYIIHRSISGRFKENIQSHLSK